MDNPIYVNGFRIAISQIETQIMFRVDSPVYDENQQFVGVSQSNVADIRISPILAKTLSKMLDQNVKEYEKQFGEITIDIGDQES